MACITKQRTGNCRHSQCSFPEESGFDCVDMVSLDGIKYCECGCGCIEKCEHSWLKGTRKERQANKAFNLRTYE